MSGTGTLKLRSRDMSETYRPRRTLRSIGAVLAGLVAIVILSLATDKALHTTGVFPPFGQPMADTLYLLAIVPIILGVGKLLFEGVKQTNLKLQGSESIWQWDCSAQLSADKTNGTGITNLRGFRLAAIAGTLLPASLKEPAEFPLCVDFALPSFDT